MFEWCLLSLPFSPVFFFFNDTATTEIYTLSLHDALPIPATEAPAKRAVRLDDVPAPLRACLPGKGRSAAAFERDVAALNRQTAERERDGEYDHLIFFLLQSRRFTNEPSIEPARSAHEFL